MSQVPVPKPSATPPPKPPKPSGASGVPTPSKEAAPQFSKPADKPAPPTQKSEAPKSAKDSLPDRTSGDSTSQPQKQESSASQPGGGDPKGPPKSSKDLLKDQRNATSSGSGGDDPKPAPQSKAESAKDAAKDKAGKAAETGLDTLAGSGTTKDLKDMVAKEDKNGDKVSMEERGISAAKNAGRAANAVFGGRNAAINTGIDKVGDALSAGSRFKKRKKRELKEAISGKDMMDAATGTDAKQRNQKKAPGIGQAAKNAGKSQDNSNNGGSASGDAEAKGSFVKKASIGAAVFVVIFAVFGMFIFGGGALIGGEDGQPSEDSDEEVMDYIAGGEEGWYEVATWAVENQEYDAPPRQIPWTMILGIAAEQTDLGRYSPYDAIDREPDRESSSILGSGGGSSGGSSGSNSGNVNIQNTGDMDRSNPAWRQQIAMEAFVSAGYSPEQSAGIVGNMITESGVEPAQAEIGKAFPSDWGWGLVQWTFGRNTTIVNKVKDELGNKYYTNDPGTLSDDEWVELMELQVAHVIEELETTHAHAGGPLKEATTAEQASSIFLEKFEVPADIPGNRPVRAAQAEEVLRIYEGGGVDSLSNGDVAVNITREEAEYLTFHTEDHVRTTPVSTMECAVPNPDPEIGGGQDEGVGPFLLNERSANQARKDGFDPQSPCVSRWIANQLSKSVGEVVADDANEYHRKAPWPYGGDVAAGPNGGGSGNSGSIASGDGSVRLPLENAGAPSSGYGPRGNPTGGGEYQMHKGTDWAVPGGTPIGAVADGVVAEVVPNNDGSGWGNYVRIDHEIGGEKVQSLYAHMQESSSLKVGDEVKAGDVVGPVGTTGDSTGDHLHLEILINGEHVDPEKWLNENGADTGNVATSLEDLVVSDNVSTSEDDDEDEAAEDEEASEDEDADAEDEDKQKFEDNVAFWEATVQRSGLFADRNASGQTCELKGGENNNSNESFTQQIIYSFHCEIAKSPELNTIEKATYDSLPDDATEDEIKDFEAEAVFKKINDRYDAEQRIIQEALQVSYTASKWDAEACTEDGERAGLFQLTADEMEAAGYKADERCDSAKNAAAAAKLFADGESVPIEDRPTDDGDFQPALGGWDNISVAVGTEDREDFAQMGSGSIDASVTGRCDEVIRDWVTQIAKKAGGSEDEPGFASLADAEDLSPEEQRARVRDGMNWSDDAVSGGMLGVGKVTPPHLSDDCTGGTIRDYAEHLGEAASSMAAEEGNEDRKKAMLGYAKWTELLRANEGGEPVVGVSALVDRLSVYNYNHPEVPVSQDSISQMILGEVGGRDGHVPLHQRAVEYAIFFGGISQPFDTAKRIYGSLEEAASNGGNVGSSGPTPGGGQSEVDATGCPVEPGPIPGAMTGGSEEIGINELCKRSVEQARDAEAATALKWGFQQVGVQMYSQPQRMDEMYSDCSSFISRAYQEAAGVRLYEPGGNAWVTSTFIAEEGAPSVPQDELVPGDWFEPSSGHIVFVIADGFIMHASQPGDPIKIGTFYTGDYNKGGTINPDAYEDVAPTVDVGGGDKDKDDKKDEKKEDDVKDED